MESGTRLKRIMISGTFIISIMTFFLLITPADLISMVIFMSIGLIVAFFFSSIGYFNRQLLKGKAALISSVLGVIFLCLNAGVFFETWEHSSLMKRILCKGNASFSLRLTVISYLLSFVSMPFVIITISAFLRLIIKGYENIEFKKIWNEQKRIIQKKEFINRLLIAIGTLSIACILGITLLRLVFLIPVRSIENNVKESADTMKEEGYAFTISGFCTSQIDNWTDSLMLLESADSNPGTTLERALYVYHGKIRDYNPQQVLTKHYCDNIAFDTKAIYPRYWHGYLVILKPLLVFFNYKMIRIINGILQLLFTIIVCKLLIDRKSIWHGISYLISYLVLMPVSLAMCIQFSTCYYILTLGALVILTMPRRMLISKISLVFFTIGIATAFFDFLTYPIATFGVPCAVYLSIIKKETIEDKLSRIIRCGVMWIMGYGCMWSAKWIIASLILKKNIVADAFNNIILRTSNTSMDGLTRLNSYHILLKNYVSFFKTPVSVFAIILILYMLRYCIANNNKRDYLIMIIPFLIVSILPAIWYLFATNHSAVHYWFTNKACVVSLLSILLGLADGVESGEI